LFDKSKIRVVVVDLDGTILDRGKLCPGVEDVLGRISGLGIEVLVATGRQMADIPKEVLDMPFLRYAVTLNGACVSDCREGRFISRRPIDQGLVLDILGTTEGKTVYEHLMHDDAFIVSTGAVEKTKERFSEYYAADRIHEINAVMLAVDSPADYIRENSITIDKLVFSFASPGKCEEVWQAIDRKFDVEAVIVSDVDIELTAGGVNKGLGVRKLAEHLGFSMSEVVAVGDSGNDAEMLKAVGFPIAMGNAPEDIQRLAAIVAPHNDENGAVKVLTELFL